MDGNGSHHPTYVIFIRTPISSAVNDINGYCQGIFMLDVIQSRDPIDYKPYKSIHVHLL